MTQPAWHIPAAERTPRSCAACGQTFHVEAGQTPAQADATHEDTTCGGGARREAFFSTDFGQGVLDAGDSDDAF